VVSHPHETGEQSRYEHAIAGGVAIQPHVIDPIPELLNQIGNLVHSPTKFSKQWHSVAGVQEALQRSFTPENSRESSMTLPPHASSVSATDSIAVVLGAHSPAAPSSAPNQAESSWS